MIRRTRTAAGPLVVGAVAIAVALLVPVIAFGHAVVFPRSSNPGAYERYTLRVPNEKTLATTRVELRVPADVKLNSFEDVPGWRLEVTKDSAQRIVGAVWTGTLPPNRFVEFPFIAVNPKSSATVSWPVLQTYGDSQVVEWTGPEGSKTPASVTTIGTASESGTGGGKTALYASIAAVVLSLVSLGMAMRKSS